MKYSINDTTLTAIGNAIREKTGSADTYKPTEMATAIQSITTGGGGGYEPENILLTTDCAYACAGPMAGKYIELFGNGTITTENVWASNNMFYNTTLKKIPFSINYQATTYREMSSMFQGAEYLETIPEMTNVYPYSLSNIFRACRRLRYLPENFGSDWNWSRVQSYAYAGCSNLFAHCNSLRTIPSSFLSQFTGPQTSTSSIYSGTFQGCYSLDEVVGLPVGTGVQTYNAMSALVSQCYRLARFTFATNEDGTPKTASWKSQTLDFSAVGFGYSTGYIRDYNPGITTDKQVNSDTTYQALKNDPDWFAPNAEYSRYNLISAIETIQSLPDCSAYCGTSKNTVKFKGAAGSKTDGGAIQDMAQEWIDLAASKGWTVTFV